MKNKNCMICKTGIDMENEFVEVKHYEKKDAVLSKGYYHVKCFRERLDGSSTLKAVQLKAMEVLEKVGNRL